MLLSVVTRSEEVNVSAIPQSIDVALAVNKANAGSEAGLIQKGDMNYPFCTADTRVTITGCLVSPLKFVIIWKILDHAE